MALSLLDAVRWLENNVLFDVSLGMWAGLLGAVGLGLVLGWLSAWPVRVILRRFAARVPEVVWMEGFERRLTAPVRLLVLITTAIVAVDLIAFPDPPAGFL